MAEFTGSATEANDTGVAYSTYFQASTSYLGNDGDPENSVFLINSIAIPQGEEVIGAFLTLIPKYADANDVDIKTKIYAHDIDDASQITTRAEYDAITRTTAFELWNFSIDAGAKPNTTTIDIKTVIQEIVSRSGWVSGNNILIVIDDNGTGTSGDDYKIFESFITVSTLDYPRLSGSYGIETAFFTEGINCSDSFTYFYENSFTENANISDSFDRIRPLTTISFSENANINDGITPLATYIKSFSESIETADFADSFNFSQWFKTYAHLAIPVYFFRLGDIEIPISSFSIRSTQDNPTYLSVVVPDYDTWGDIIAANTSEKLYIDMAFKVGGLISLRENIMWTHFNDAPAISEGGSSKSITLSGYRTISTPAQTITTTLSPVSRSVDKEGKLNFQFAIPDIYAKAGDTYIIGDETIIINSITYNINATQQSMSISE